MLQRSKLIRYAWLSIGTAVFTIILKAAAYAFTGSVGLLSDALESGVNLATAVLSLIVLTIAARPPDAEHPHGHGKAEYFSSGIEGLLILAAAGGIALTAVRALLTPQPLAQLGVGVGISLVAAAGNLITAQLLIRAGQQHDSITLKASGHHLMSDVVTSIGIVAAIGLIAVTGWQWLDGLIGLAVALHITRAGYRLLHDSLQGLMDQKLSAAEQQRLEQVLASYQSRQVQYHALRTRQAGAQRFVSVHIQVPGSWSVQQGHELLEEIERDMRRAVSPLHITTHLEPLEDPISWADLHLNRATAD